MVLLRSRAVRSIAVLLALLAGGCKPDLSGRSSQITGTRVLAVQSTPAEVETQDAVTYDALVVDPSGEVAAPGLDWAYCALRKPLDELDSVNPACLQASGDGIVELGAGATASGTIPRDACRNFGPDVPSASPGQPQGRPVDPDPTGGYYQPLRVLLSAGDGVAPVIGTTRVACGLASASASDSAVFRARYHPNQNPSVLSVTSAASGGAPLGEDDADATPVTAGAAITLTVSWPDCPASDACGDGVCGADESKATCSADCTTPVGCGGAERYVYYDLEQRAVTVVRESMRVSWFTTGGAFASDRTGREGSDTATTTSDVLTLPPDPGLVHGWVVLRDDRGGVGWKPFVLDVK